MAAECFPDRQHDGAAARVTRRVADAVGEAVRRGGRVERAVALRVRADVGRTEHPARDVLRHAELVIGVVEIAVPLRLEQADVTEQAPAAAHVVGRGKIEVVGAARIRDREVVAQRMEPLGREPFPAAADIELGVVHRARIGLRRVGIGRAKDRSVRARVVVVDSADVEAEVAERLLPAAVEVHLEVAAGETGALAHVRVPVAEINAACMAVIETALQRGLAGSLINAAEPVFRDQGHVSGNRRRRRCRSRLRAREARHERGRGDCQWNDQLAHLMLSLRMISKRHPTVSISCAIAFMLSLPMHYRIAEKSRPHLGARRKRARPRTVQRTGANVGA